MIQASTQKSPLEQKRLGRRIEYVRKRFGEGQLIFAYHAAFPSSLTVDLLYRIWSTFQRDIHGKPLNIPWVSISDLLFSPLCEEIGYELYEMNEFIRSQLLKNLKSDERFGDTRIRELAEFLMSEYQLELNSSDPDVRDLAHTQRWTALAYSQPRDAVYEIALSLSNLGLDEPTEWARMVSLIEAFQEPFDDAGFSNLIAYVRGMYYWLQDDREQAACTLGNLLVNKDQFEIEGVRLFIPKIEKFKNVEPVTILSLSTFNFVAPSIRKVPKVWFLDSGWRISKISKQAEFFLEDLETGFNLEMVLVPQGELRKNTQPSDNSIGIMRVNSFFISKYPITKQQWRRVAELPQISIPLSQNPTNMRGPHNPVVRISCYEAIEFCERLSQRTGRLYRLPTEVEWEYACRAGTESIFAFGDKLLPQWANFYQKTSLRQNTKSFVLQDRTYGESTFVGFFKLANNFGLYDMHGNVWEWCSNSNLTKDQTITMFPVRGGSWMTHEIECSSTSRKEVNPKSVSSEIGFRVILPYQ